MTEHELTSPDAQRAALADAFDRPVDPLAEVEDGFLESGVDPFDLFRTEVLEERGLASSTYRHFDMVFEEWQDFMEREGRHPACPNPEHVEAYIRWQTNDREDGGKDNVHRTVKEKLRKLNQAYRYWQQDAAFPHPAGYNPIYVARDRNPLPVHKEKEHRRIPIPELRDMVASVTDLRARSLIALQLKLGLRAGEIANLRLGDLRMQDSGARGHFAEMGNHERLEGYEDVVYVPWKHERDGNKSSRPRLLPFDTEVKELLDRYLLIRPDNGQPWVFLSKKSHSQMTTKDVNKVWKDAFHPEYAETAEHRPVTSHFGRHRFTTYWWVEMDINRQLVKYMRSDRTGAFRNDRGMNAYLHAYYEDIEGVCRENIYRLEA